MIILTLVLGACRSSPPPATQPPNLEKVPSPTPPEMSLEVVDNGSPLPPELVEQQPAEGQELSLTGEVVFTFNQPMDAQSTSSAFDMTSEDDTQIKGEINWSSPRTMHFKPNVSLKPDSHYRVTLTTEATSSRGVPLSDPLRLQFLTVGPLRISQVFPADGATEVANTAVITAIFNRPVVPLSIAEENSRLSSPLTIMPEVSGKGEWVNTSVYAFKPDKPLEGDTQYKISIRAGLSDALQETQLGEDFTWKFNTVAPSIQSLELGSGTVNPEDNYQNLLLDDYFNINFFQPMDRASTESALSIMSQAGESVELVEQWNGDFTRLEITPTERLDLGTNYTLSLNKAAQAASGGDLSDGLDWHFSTVPFPAVSSVSPGNGTVQDNFNSELRIQFASPMNIESVKERITISPKPAKDFEWFYQDWDWSIVAYILEPSTRYEVRLLPGMEDIYGNQIQQGQTARFTTAAFPPTAYLQMPYQPILVRQDGPQDFYAYYRNAKSISFKLFQVRPELMINFLTGKTAAYDYVPPDSELVWRLDKKNSASLNKVVLDKITPTTADGSPLSVGFYFLGMDAVGVQKYNAWLDYRLLIVANANLTFKSTSTDSLIWVTDLTSGHPLNNVGAGIYDQDFNLIGDGITDADGLLHLDIPAPDDPYSSRFAIAQSGDTFAFATSNADSGVPMWDYGSYAGYYAPANQPTAYVYTERPIYRPGQPVYFKGIVRLDDDLAYSLPRADVVNVKISSFEETVFEGDLPLSDYATFDGKFTLDQQAALGYYSLEVALPEREGAIGQVGFTVAEYRRPEFKVTVIAEPDNVLSGDMFTSTVQADYYSGGAVIDAEVNWTLTSEAFTFAPPDEYSSYSFSDIDIDTNPNEEGAPTSEVVAQGSGRTDDHGMLIVALPADLSEATSSRTLTFEATVTDLSNNAVSGRAQVIGHRSAIYPGARPQSYVGTAGNEESFEFVALDWNGKPIANQNLSVEIVERRWYSVQEQDANGRIQWKSTVEDIPVKSDSVIATDDKGMAVVSYFPPNGGIFRARVTALDSQGNPGKASAYMWVADKDYVPWQQTNDRSFDLVTDRKRYSPGDTAEILIASPFQGQAYALVTVERGRIHYQKVVLLENNSTLYRLPITLDMAPNAFISVLVVKGIDENNPRPNYKLGVVEIDVDRGQQELTVELTADPNEAEPGAMVQYKIRTLNYKGDPVRAEVSLGLSDLATLSLLPANSLPIMDHFYSKRTLGVWTVVPINAILEEYNAFITQEVVEGGRGGGGGGKGIGDLGVVEVRQDFPDTAFWEAHIQTDDQGNATVSVTLPDNLTTWRMDARAVTEDTLVGQTTLDIISTKLLLVRPQTPRFFVAGDQATLGAAIHNNTDNDLDVTVSLQGTGLTIDDPASQSIHISAKSQSFVTWNVMINAQIDRVDLVFSAEGGGLQDASRPPQGTLDNQGIPVYRYEAPETMGTSGQLLEAGTVVEAINLPDTFQVTQGELTIKLDPSLAASMTDSLTYLDKYPYECIEQTISRFLPNVIVTRALKTAGLSDPKLEANLKSQVETTLQGLYNGQNPDGGWGWWRNEKSDPLTSAYVVLGLLEAEDAGYTVSSQVVSEGLGYLNNSLLSIVRLTSPELLNRQAFLLYVLARGGKPDVSRSVQIFDQRQNMAYYARAFLAQTLSIIDDSDPRLATLLSDLASAAVLSATGSHWEEQEPDPWNWNTDTRTTAIVLSALSHLDTQNPINANAVRWLMAHRQNGHWQGTQETAWTLMALTNWMAASGELQADYLYAVTLNGERLGGGQANSDTLRDTKVLRVHVADLLSQEANRLAIAKGEGPGNLYYTAQLNAYLPVEQISALDQGLTISRSYYRLDDLNNPVSEASQGELLLARLTLVAPNDVHYILIDDPLPAGLEAVDQSLSTSPQSLEVPQVYSWDDVFWRGWGWWYFTHVQYRDEKVVLSTSYLPAGTYIYTYLVRAFTMGSFKTIPPTAQEFYFPEVYGRGDGTIFTINP